MVLIAYLIHTTVRKSITYSEKVFGLDASSFEVCDSDGLVRKLMRIKDLYTENSLCLKLFFTFGRCIHIKNLQWANRLHDVIYRPFYQNLWKCFRCLKWDEDKAVRLGRSLPYYMDIKDRLIIRITINQA